MKPEKKLLRYTRFFNEKKLIKKLKAFSGELSVNLLYYALILYILTTDKSVPYKNRIIFIAALGYLILPTDLVSDLIPGLGFSDDAAFITYAISNATTYLTPELREKALARLATLVGTEKTDQVKFK